MAVLLALASFALGVAVTRWWPRASDPPEPGGGDAGPQLLIDAGGIELLPDASLHLDLPPPPSVGP